MVTGSTSASTGVAPAWMMAFDRRGEGERRRDHLVAGPHAQGEHREVQGRRARVHGDGVRRPDVGCEVALEARDLGPGAEPPAAQRGDDLGDLVLADGRRAEHQEVLADGASLRPGHRRSSGSSEPGRQRPAYTCCSQISKVSTRPTSARSILSGKHPVPVRQRAVPGRVLGIERLRRAQQPVHEPERRWRAEPCDIVRIPCIVGSRQAVRTHASVAAPAGLVHVPAQTPDPSRPAHRHAQTRPGNAAVVLGEGPHQHAAIEAALRPQLIGDAERELDEVRSRGTASAPVPSSCIIRVPALFMRRARFSTR